MNQQSQSGSEKRAIRTSKPSERVQEDFEILDQEAAANERNPEKDHKVLGLIQRVRKLKGASKTQASEGDTARQHQTLRNQSSPSFPTPIEFPADLADQLETHQIDRFQIKRQLGKGGYGFVFLAYDPMLDRDVALKVPRPEVLLDLNLRFRFKREAKAAASLSHPNIVPVFESGGEGPVCFIAYEYIQGITLAEWLSEHPNRITSDQRMAATMISSLAEAIEHAHQRGVWHRDLKPANVMLKTPKRQNSEESTNGEEPPDQRDEPAKSPVFAANDLASLIPMITDFGLAKIVTESELSIDTTNATCTHAIVGTPAYMAPEQTMAGEQSFDARADIYSLGAILYEMLTGRPPFQGSNVIDTLQKIQKIEPVDPKKLNTTVSRDLSAICLKCLEKSPSSRYSSAFDLHQDLSRFLEGRNVVARPVTRFNKLTKWYQRNPLLASSMTTAVCAVVIGLIAVTTLWLRSDFLRTQAESRGIALTERTQQLELKTELLQIKTEQLNSAIRGLFLEVAKSEEIKSPAAAKLRQSILERANQFYLSVISQQPDDQEFRRGRAETLFELAKVFEYLGDPDGALRLVRQAIDEVNLDSANPLDLINWHNYAGFRLHQLGRLEEANGEFSKALSIASKDGLNLDEPSRHSLASQMVRATILTNQADLRNADKDVDGALELSNTAMQIFQILEQDSNLSTDRDYLFNKSNCFRIRGRAFGNLRQYEKHEACLVAAIEILEGMVNDDVHLHHAARLNLGKCYFEKGVCHSRKNELAAARDCYHQALEQFDELPESLDLHLTREEEYHRVDYSLAVVDMLMGNFAEAEATILGSVEPIARLIEQIPEESPSYLDSLGDRFNLLYVIRSRAPEKSLADAEQAIRRAIDYYEQTLQQRPDWAEAQMALVQAQTNLGNVLVRQNQIEDAIEQYSIAEKSISGLLQSRPNWANVRRGMCNLLQGKMDARVSQGQFEEALSLCRQAQDFLASGMLNHMLLDESWILANLDNMLEARGRLEGFGNHHAQGPRDFIAVARKSIEISNLKPDSPSESDFRNLAVAFLNQGLPSDTDRQTDFLQEIQNDDHLRDLVPMIKKSN